MILSYKYCNILKYKKTKSPKLFFGYKTKENAQNPKIGYGISILYENEENKLCLTKIDRLVQKL